MPRHGGRDEGPEIEGRCNSRRDFDGESFLLGVRELGLITTHLPLVGHAEQDRGRWTIAEY